MGVRNQQRRAAKKKAREQRERRRNESGANAEYGPFAGGVFQPPAQSPEERVDGLWLAAVRALAAKQPEEAEWSLTELAASDQPLVDRVLTERFQQVVSGLWPRGWLPADLVRVVRREHGKRPATLVLEQIAEQLRGYPEVTVPERWRAQLRELGAVVWQTHDDHRLTAWAARQKLDRFLALQEAASVLGLLATLPKIEVLTALPGTVRAGASGTAPRGSRTVPAGASARIDERLLGRVRGLLAKAESTEFPEEAEALSAKAQELMAKHSIDHALLAADQHGSKFGTERPVGVRVGVDAPYEQAKALLLQEVGTANRCRTVWSGNFGFVTVLGFAPDVESVELLYTSLLVQATSAMVRGGAQRVRGAPSTSRSYRQSFLQAYAVRIGERLRTAADEVSRAAVAEQGADRLLPVLVAREDVVREAVEEMFPEIVQRTVRGGRNADGWLAGTAAADLAALGARSAVADAGNPHG